MSGFLDVTHVALNVSGGLREAEDFYCRLLGLRVAWREPVPDGVAFDAPWDDFVTGGTEPQIAMLHEGALRLSVTADGSSLTSGVINHVGLQVTAEQLSAIRHRVIDAGYRTVAHRAGELLDFIDPYGVEWELDTRSFEDPQRILEAKLGRPRGGRDRR